MITAKTPDELLEAMFGARQHDDHMILYRWHMHALRFGSGFYAKSKRRA